MSIDKIMLGRDVSNVSNSRITEVECDSCTVNQFDIRQGPYNAENLIAILNARLHHLNIIILESMSLHQKRIKLQLIAESSTATVSLKTSCELLYILGIIGE
jgi:hypothetical protein